MIYIYKFTYIYIIYLHI